MSVRLRRFASLSATAVSSSSSSDMSGISPRVSGVSKSAVLILVARR